MYHILFSELYIHQSVVNNSMVVFALVNVKPCETNVKFSPLKIYHFNSHSHNNFLLGNSLQGEKVQ